MCFLIKYWYCYQERSSCSFSMLLPQEGSALKSKGKASNATRVLVLTWRSLLIMSREWKYYWFRLILYMMLTLCIGTLFSGLGHSLSSVSVSLMSLLCICLYVIILVRACDFKYLCHIFLNL